jgi:hypothetical protein
MIAVASVRKILPTQCIVPLIAEYPAARPVVPASDFPDSENNSQLAIRMAITERRQSVAKSVARFIRQEVFLSVRTSSEASQRKTRKPLSYKETSAISRVRPG